MSRLEELLASPSPESWHEIIMLGKLARKNPGLPDPVTLDGLLDGNSVWSLFCKALVAKLRSWPPEIERLCPESWPREFRDAVEHRVNENDTYEHYVAKVCGDSRLRLSDGKTQAAWLERRFTGGVVPVSTAQIALRSLSAALASLASSHRAPSIAAATRMIESASRHLESARNMLSNGVRRVGKVGCADLTGGLTVERNECQRCHGAGCLHPAKSCGPSRSLEYRLEIEVKVGNEPQRPEQVVRMNSVRSRGGCYVLARSVEEAVQAIIAFRDSR